MVLCSVSVDGRLNVNVALNRPSYSSSVFGGLLPSLTNDGNVDTNFLNCSHTNAEMNPWYAFDLGVKLHVAGIKFTNRADDEFGALCTLIGTQRLAA